MFMKSISVFISVVDLVSRLIVDFRLGSYIVDEVATMHQSAVLAIEKVFHATD